ncbi:hypothetical protein MRX96_029158 [Rhipicephalus microplus]
MTRFSAAFAAEDDVEVAELAVIPRFLLCLEVEFSAMPPPPPPSFPAIGSFRDGSQVGRPTVSPLSAFVSLASFPTHSKTDGPEGKGRPPIGRASFPNCDAPMAPFACRFTDVMTSERYREGCWKRRNQRCTEKRKEWMLRALVERDGSHGADGADSSVAPAL